MSSKKGALGYMIIETMGPIGQMHIRRKEYLYIGAISVSTPVPARKESFNRDQLRPMKEGTGFASRLDLFLSVSSVCKGGEHLMGFSKFMNEDRGIGSTTRDGDSSSSVIILGFREAPGKQKGKRESIFRSGGGKSEKGKGKGGGDRQTRRLEI